MPNVTPATSRLPPVAVNGRSQIVHVVAGGKSFMPFTPIVLFGWSRSLAQGQSVRPAKGSSAAYALVRFETLIPHETLKPSGRLIVAEVLKIRIGLHVARP